MPYKNHETLLEAIALGWKQGLRLCLTLVGDGPLRPAIERRIDRLRIADRVRLTGMLTGRAKIEAELDAADLFVMPSWSEGLPRAVIEAMARGLPVIGSAVPGIRELLPRSSLFDPGRPEQIAALIGRLRIAADYRRSAEQSVRIAQEFVADVISPRRQALYRRFREIALDRSVTCSSLDAALARGAAR